MLNHRGSVSVIVPAYNAAATIGRPWPRRWRRTRSAKSLSWDDASSDGTGAVGCFGGGGDERLLVLANATNRGPSFSRNRAMAQGTSPYVALLDADDFFLEGRLSAPPSPAAEISIGRPTTSSSSTRMSRTLWTLHSLTSLARRGRADHGGLYCGKHEKPCASAFGMGFLKPLIRRDAFARFGLTYAEEMRLGEDFVLYTRALTRRARFVLDRSCGYVATVRPGSLSGITARRISRRSSTPMTLCFASGCSIQRRSRP